MRLIQSVKIKINTIVIDTESAKKHELYNLKTICGLRVRYQDNLKSKIGSNFVIYFDI